MTELPAAFLAAWEKNASGSSREALAVFLTLASQSPASPASIAKRLELPQANVLRALTELTMLISISEEMGRAGKRMVSMTPKGETLQSLLKSP